MCCTRLAANTWCKKSHLRTITQLCRAISSQLRHASTIEKNLLNSNISSTWSRNMANFVPLAAEIGLAVWGTTANLNGFCILPLFLQRCHSLEANWTLHDVWPSPELRHYMYVFRVSCPWQNFVTCKFHFASKSCSLLYWQHYCMAFEQQGQPNKEWNYRTFAECNLYSAARPLCWVSAHILVFLIFFVNSCICVCGIRWCGYGCCYHSGIS